MDLDYPLPAFHFAVSVGGDVTETSFREVSGLKWEVESEDVREGGVNTFVHRLPNGGRHPPLVLRRGILPLRSVLFLWCRSVLQEFSVPVRPRVVLVTLLEEHGLPIMAWSCENAWPASWEIDAFDSQKNEVAAERIELHYTQLVREF